MIFFDQICRNCDHFVTTFSEKSTCFDHFFEENFVKKSQKIDKNRVCDQFCWSEDHFCWSEVVSEKMAFYLRFC